jgi:hypothetical protein
MTSLVYPACFLALATVSGLAAAGGRRWAFRLPLLALTPVLALAVWWQLSLRDGWPTSAHPADGSSFVASVVQAPTPDDAGAIYLWAQPPSSDTPQSFRLPYSRELEQQVARASSAAKTGARVGVRAASKPTGAAPRRAGRAHTRGGRTEVASSHFEFFRLPPPKLQLKGQTG